MQQELSAMRGEAENNASAANILNQFIKDGEADVDPTGRVTLSKNKVIAPTDRVALDEGDLSAFSFPPVDENL